jgi:NAD(P)-dependent dehydrogenase (short-subunit alcohol dehydrogenase family)
MHDFNGKTAVVTGAASGIGLELAKIFAGEGMQLVLADIERDSLQHALDDVQASGAQAIAVVTDVGDSSSVAALAQSAQSRFGDIHIVCNNAGVYSGGMLWEQTEEDYEWLMRVNQWGVIHGIRHFVPLMIAHGQPCHMVNTASMAALCTLPFAGIYHMTKHAVLALSECLFHELALTAPQMNVSCLCPELADTGIATSRRNRPAALAHENPTPMSEMSHTAIADATAGALHPAVLAQRVLQGIKDEQFYLLPPQDNPWRETAAARLEDIQEVRNPRFMPPAI